MNKYLKYGFLGLCASVALTSCQDTLDTHPTTTFDEATVWGSKATADAFVYATYSDVLGNCGGGSGSCVGWESRTPNSARCSQVSEGIDGVATELGVNTSSDFGMSRFSILRKCNLILEKVAESNLAEAEKAELTAQACFLRGMVFFDQARKIGRLVPVKQVFNDADTVACRIPMTTGPAESYKYVIDDLKAAVAGLPESAPTGIASKSAAQVILSRAALQAYAYTKDASYIDLAIENAKAVVESKSLTDNYGSMFNETDPYNSEILLGIYRLSQNTSINSYEELIRTYPNINADDAKLSLSPVNFNNKNGKTFDGWAIYFPTQDLVDQYLVTDEETGKALPWYETSQFKNNVDVLDASSVTTAGQVDYYERSNGELRRIPTPQDLAQLNSSEPAFSRYIKIKAGAGKTISDIMYSGRDKRFASSIVYDNCEWIGEHVDLNLGGNLSQGVRDKEDGGWYNTTTGYYWRKNTLENPDPRCFYTVKIDYHLVLARVGEAYMNLAEAYLLKGNVAEAVNALNATRVKHGGLTPSEASTLEDAWADYMRERRVEMANENADIYFSYLRWGKYGGHANHGLAAGDIIKDLDSPVHKIEITRDRSAALIGQLTLLNSAARQFTVKRYLLPVPQKFLNTREAYGLDCVQNEGW